jgi:hypothetical protein
VAQDFVTVDLGETGADARFEPPPSPVTVWQRRALVATLFAFGLIVGVLGWQARVDSAAEVELVAGGAIVRAQAVPDAPQLRSVGISLYNAGSHDVTLVGLELPGWQPGTPESYNQLLRASAWTPVNVLAAPTCDVPPPDDVVVTVRRDADDITRILALPPEQLDLGTIGAACHGDAEPISVVALQDRQWLNSRSDGLLVTTLNVIGSVADDQVVSLSVTAGGVSGEPVDLPVPMLVGGRIDVAWQITDCALAEQIDEVVFVITVESIAGQRTETVTVPDPHLTYTLANYVAREC